MSLWVSMDSEPIHWTVMNRSIILIFVSFTLGVSAYSNISHFDYEINTRLITPDRRLRRGLKYLNGYRKRWSFDVPTSSSTSLLCNITATLPIPASPLSTANQSFTEVVSTSVKVPPLLSKSAFEYNDTSIQFVPQLRKMLREYADLFSADFTEALDSEDLDPFKNLFSHKTGMYGGSRERDSFLYAGDASFRTRENCYIIKLRSNAMQKTVKDIISVIQSINGQVKQVFEEAIKGIVACFEPYALPLYVLRSIDWIDIVERDQTFEACQRQSNAPWGLARVSTCTKSRFSSSFDFDLTGKGVNIFVIDSGVFEGHPEFSKRARVGYSSFGGSLGSDCSGHGTEVAAVIGGVNVGVAKQANIIAVQVLDCNRQGQNSHLVSALDWIVKNGAPPAVINLSVGGPSSPSLDEAVSTAVAKGFVVVVAAGNSAIDACLMSPSSASGAIVVGAINEEDRKAPFSNFGKCLTLFAPGMNILTASILNKKKKQSKLDGYDIVSGTSLAAPFASGVIALLLEKEPKLTPLEIKSRLIEMAAKNILDSQSLLSSPNVLLQAPKASRSGKLVNLFTPGSKTFTRSSKSGRWNFEGTISIVVVIVGIMIAFSIMLALVHKRFKERTQLAASLAEESK